MLLDAKIQDFERSRGAHALTKTTPVQITTPAPADHTHKSAPITASDDEWRMVRTQIEETTARNAKVENHWCIFRITRIVAVNTASAMNAVIIGGPNSGTGTHPLPEHGISEYLASIVAPGDTASTPRRAVW